METFGLSRIGQVALPVHDVAEAIAFYRDRLGMRLLFSAPTPDSGEGPGMAFFDCDGTRLLLGRPAGPEEDHPGSILYFRVEDIASAHRTLADRGVDFIREPEQVADLGHAVLWLAFFRDPWENTLALMAEVPKAS